MDTPLDDVAFLTRSENRIRLLELLATNPRDRAELRSELDVSRVTLGQMLGEFEDREWITQSDNQYTISPFGALMAEEVTSLLDTTATLQKLRGTMRWLPTEEIDIALRQFSDANVTVPTPGDPNAPARRAAEIHRGATERIKAIIYAVTPWPIQIDWEKTKEGSQSFDAIFWADAIETIAADTEMSRWMRDLVESGQNIYRYEGNRGLSQPYDLVLVDEIVIIVLSDDRNTEVALIDTDNEVVRSWAEDTFEAYQREATPIDLDVFAE